MSSCPSGPPTSKAVFRLSFVKRYLDPTDRLSEVLFGLIMVLSFTLGAGLIVQEGRDATQHMLLGILGCNLAWGFIDGGMYIISCLFERSRKARLLEAIQKSANEQEAFDTVANALDDRLESFTSAAERKHLYAGILRRLQHVSVDRTRLKKEDLYGALASFWLVFSTTIPAVLPFLFFSDRFVALRVSNGLLLASLFGVGYRCARATHSNPWLFGATLLLAGLMMVGFVIALGG